MAQLSPGLLWDEFWKEFWWLFGQIICWRTAIESVNVLWRVFWVRTCIKCRADGLCFPLWMSGVNQWAHRGRFVGKLFYLPFLCLVMGKAKWLLTALSQWLGPNKSKVFWWCWYNEDEVAQLIIAAIQRYQTSRYFIFTIRKYNLAIALFLPVPGLFQIIFKNGEIWCFHIFRPAYLIDSDSALCHVHIQDKG